MSKPNARPARPDFSSGPCAKRPGWTPQALHDAAVGNASTVALDLELRVRRGAVGIGLVDDAGSYLPAAEAVIAAGEDWRHVTLRAAAGRPASLRLRNLYAGRRGHIEIRSAFLRAEP